MTTLRVWAPNAERVDAVVGERRHPMTRVGDRGWWAVDADLGSAQEYWFAVDGGPPHPDPRSPHQPHGVEGPSRAVDHAAFRWTDGNWRGVHLPSAVLYELHVGTFTPAGTFVAAIDRLDHLVDLGATAVELMPVAEFAGDRGWGYDGVDLYAPHHAYGGPEGLKQLVDACHAKGLGVVMDVVYNHLGPAGNYLATFGPYFTDRYSTPWGDAVNLDGPDSVEVRNFFIDNAIMWLRDYHCDGLRLDAVHALFDASAIHFLEELTARVDAFAAHDGRPRFVTAENDLNDPRMVRPPQAGGYGVAAGWSDDVHHALHSGLTGETDGYYADFGSLAAVAKACRQPYVYDGVWSEYRRRIQGRPSLGLSGRQFVAYAQNHDQIGNRAQGERTSALISEGRLRIAAALVLLSPYVPLLFMGEEWGASTPFQYFTDHRDPDLARAVRDGRRREFASFGWPADDIPDPQDQATFERSKLDWNERDRPFHRGMLDWHRSLLKLRRSMPSLTDGPLDSVRTTFDEDAGWLAVERADVAIVANLGSGPADVTLSHPVREPLMAWPASPRVVGAGTVVLEPDAIAVLRVATPP